MAPSTIDLVPYTPQPTPPDPIPGTLAKGGTRFTGPTS